MRHPEPVGSCKRTCPTCGAPSATSSSETEDGYRLDITRGQVDAFRFEDAVAEGRSLILSSPSEAADHLAEALALWRGRPYADVPGSVRLESEARRLKQLRVGAVEDRVEAELSLGRTSELVPELEVLTSEFPLSERFRAQHMLALYRAGRQGDALSGLPEDPALPGRGDGDQPVLGAAGAGAAHLDHRPRLHAERAAAGQTSRSSAT